MQGCAVRDNGRSRAGDRYTGAVVQYESDGILDGHHIFSQLDEVKSRYGCFLRSLVAGGRGSVPAPAPLDSGCP